MDIIDIKNPDEGTLGANHPWVIKEIKKILPEDIESGASIGDLDFKPGTASLAALGAATCKVDYITASMYGVKTSEEVGEMTKKISKAIKDYDQETKLIIAGYADYHRIGSANPFDFVNEINEAEIIMVDTAIKDGKNILDFASVEKLSELQDTAHELDLKVVFAGSIRLPHLPVVAEINPDILGFRGVVCENGKVKREMVEKLKEEVKKL